MAIHAGRFKSHFQKQIKADIQNFINSVHFAFNETLLLKAAPESAPTSNGLPTTKGSRAGNAQSNCAALDRWVEIRFVPFKKS